MSVSIYTLQTPLSTVKGIGPALSAVFEKRELHTVKDLLLFVPLRYEDRSLRKLIYQLVPGELVTIEAEVTSSRNFYKGRRSIQSATVQDHTGKLQLMWFNNPHVVQRLAKGKKLLFSGKLNERGTIIQPTVETPSDDTVHTGRLVPIYSAIPGIPPATLRKLLKHIIDHLINPEDILKELAELHVHTSIYPLADAICHLHFPDNPEHITQARERFAVEELLSLIHHSHQIKAQWQQAGEGTALPQLSVSDQPQLPFTLTTAQQRCVQEITTDIANTIPMNRLLIGDVGSGKTAVAGWACVQTVTAGHHAMLVAPTQILAEQHFHTFQKLFPTLAIELITAQTKKAALNADQPKLWIGTHAVLNKRDQLKPALVIYDEQHRFGVTQRSLFQDVSPRPHLLTLSATPIPRTLMLTIFSHLQLSVIDEMPAGRKPVKTWLVPHAKRNDSYEWIAQEIKEHNSQALIVCPFIDPSEAEALENVAAATQLYETVQKIFKKLNPTLRVAILHGRTPKKEQSVLTQQLYHKEIDILVTTPIIEVGVDLPAASMIVIEGAERFGLASLHQMRGRVGRAGQQGYCLLFTSNENSDAQERLKEFCQTHEGLKLAEHDLQRRGAGDIFGTQQHGFDNLQFANWTNLELITQAKQIADTLETQQLQWQPFLEIKNSREEVPLAN